MATTPADRNAEATRIDNIYLKEIDLKIGLIGLMIQGMRKYERILYHLESARLEIAELVYESRNKVADTPKTYADRIVEILEEEQNKKD
jgi:hypothetical protein